MNASRANVAEYPFTGADFVQAEKEFGCVNCGPSALSVMTNLPLSVVMPAIPNYKDRHYTNPTMMATALRALGVLWHERDDAEVTNGHTLTKYGLIRIQWEGPWTAAGSNPKWAYRATHWVGAISVEDDNGTVLVFDINCGWSGYEHWAAVTVPEIIKECVPRATGGWFATHRWELEL